MVRIHGRVIPVVLAVLGVLGVVSVDAIRGEPLPAAEAVDLNDEVLRDRARPGLEVGAVVHGYDPEWRLDPGLDVVEREMAAVTATAYLPWGGWPDGAAAPDTSGFADVVDWARERDLAVHGHTLVYPRANAASPWFAELDAGHEEALRRWVDTVAGVRRGEVWVWDVVNEVMADPGDPAVDGWGLKTDWIEYEQIGADYVDKAFRWAEAADPDAQLILNDYGAEELNEKSDRLFAYVTELRDRGVPIDGVGFQMHLWAIGDEPNWPSIRANFQRFADAGFDLYITELDVPIVRTADASQRPTAAERSVQRSVFEEAARLATEQAAVKSLLLWDLTDDRSWLHPTRNDLGPETPAGTFTFPTPFTGGRIGSTAEPKPAWWGLHEGLRTDGLWMTPGVWQLSSVHRPRNSLLTRRGVSDDGVTWSVTGTVDRNRATAEARGWTSTRWMFDVQTDGTVVLVNGWEPESGVLTRVGDGVELRAPDGSAAQRWRVEVADRTVRIVSLDGPETGVLTSGSGAIGVRLTEDRGVVAADPGSPAVARQRWLLTPVG